MPKGFLRKILLPREDKFYPLFEEMGEIAGSASRILLKIISDPKEADRLDSYSEVKNLESKADNVVHTVLDSVDSTFITPFDREDIQRLVSKMDDVIDLINSTSQQVKLYRPEKLVPRFTELAELVVVGCEQIKIAAMELRNLKKPEYLQSVCQKMNEIENQADDVYHELISDLFDHETNPIELVKNKEILETLELVTDAIEDVSDVLKTIMIKTA
jgi:predicted phosphate transport protein (TIGR00153 family)